MSLVNQFVGQDAVNLLCGERLGSGVYRDVFACKLRPDLVVKVEYPRDDGARNFENVAEARNWRDFEHDKRVNKWLAPVEYVSPDGYILLMQRVAIATEADLKRLPEQLPAFLTDRKFGNYGWTNDGRLVCVDYASLILDPSMRKTKSNWW